MSKRNTVEKQKSVTDYFRAKRKCPEDDKNGSNSDRKIRV